MPRIIDKNNPGSWPYVLHPKHIMAITGMGKNKVLDLLGSGNLPAKRVGGRWLIQRDAFLQWLSEHR